MPKTREELELEAKLAELEEELGEKGRLKDLKSKIIRFVEESEEDCLDKLTVGNARIMLYGNGKGILIYPSLESIKKEDDLKKAIIRLSEFSEDRIKYSEMTLRQKVITCKEYLKYTTNPGSYKETWEKFLRGTTPDGRRTILDLISGNEETEGNIVLSAEGLLEDAKICFVNGDPNLPKITKENALIVINGNGFMIFPSLETVADDKLLDALIYLDSPKHWKTYASLTTAQKEIAVAAFMRHIKEEHNSCPRNWKEFIEENPKYNSILEDRRNAELAGILLKMGRNLCFVKEGKFGFPKLEIPLTKGSADIVYKKPYYIVFPYISGYFERECIAKALNALDTIKASTPYGSLNEEDKKIALYILDKKLGKGNTDLSLSKIQNWSDYLDNNESSQGKGSPRISYRKMLDDYRKNKSR